MSNKYKDTKYCANNTADDSRKRLLLLNISQINGLIAQVLFLLSLIH